MKKYRALIFDWDGTLADSTACIVDAVRYAFAQIGLIPPAETDARSIIGLSLDDAMLHLNPTITAQQRADLVKYYRLHYFQNDHNIRLFVDAQQWLPVWAERYTLGIATGKSRRGLERGLDETGIRRYFQATRTADECASKPAPDMILSLCGEWDMLPEEVLMIGDTTHDLLTAANAGAAAVGIAAGAHTRKQLCAAPHAAVFERLAELETWLKD